MKRRIVIVVSLLYIVWMAVCFFYLHSKGESFRALVAVGGIVCGAIPLHMALFSKWQFNLGIVLSYLLFLFLAQFLGTILNFYGFGWWDTFLHFISGGIIAFIALVLYEAVIRRNGGINLPPWFVFLTSLSIAACAGVVWEIYEYFTDQFFGTKLQGIGVTDTMTDLIADVSGGLVIALYAAIRTRIRLKKEKIKNNQQYLKG